MKTDTLQIRVSEVEKADLAEVAAKLDTPASVIVREAISEKVAKLQRTHPKLKKIAVETA